MTDIEDMRRTVHDVAEKRGDGTPLNLVDDILDMASAHSEDFIATKNSIYRIVESYLNSREGD